MPLKTMMMLVALLGLAACGSTGEFGDEYYRMDANRDRVLSRAEMASFYPASVFDEMDVDGSGGVSPMEYRRHPNQNRND